MRNWIFTFALLFASCSAFSKGLSPYLPLQISPEIELYIEKLFAVADGVPLSKPYKAVDILAKANSVKRTHPRLYRKLSNYLQRYQKQGGRTHSSIELTHSNDDATLPNQRGANYGNNYRISTTGFYQYNPYTIVSLGIEKQDSGSPVHYSSYFGFGYEYAQVEVGYRDHWFSPFQDSAMLTSINAAPSPSITISNATPLTKWNIRYEAFVSRLEKLRATESDVEVNSKYPKLAGLHVSFNPLPFWTIGVNRTVQYGDNLSDVGLADLADDFLDPNSSTSEVDISNHLASVTTKLNLDFGTPFSLYAEYGGETSDDKSSFGLGEETISVGVFLPTLYQNLSLRYEYNQWSKAWYVHPVFAEGYSNKGNIIGHWAAGLYPLGSNEATKVHSLMLSTETRFKSLVDTTFRMISSDDRFDNYQTGYDLQIRYSHATQNGFWGLELNAASDLKGNKQSRIAVFYRW
jgi:hypothetical protein